MHLIATEEAEQVTDLMRRFLYQSPCSFASSLAHGGAHFRWLVVGGRIADATSLPDAIEEQHDVAGEHKQTLVVVFPEMRTQFEIARLLLLLAGSPRWRVDIAPNDGKHPHDDVLVSLWWRTSAGGKLSSAMGLAPHASMPVTRRAPFVGIATWPGDHANPYKKSKEGVGFVDAPTGIKSKELFTKTWSKTLKQVRDALKYPPDGSARHDVAFSLRKEHEAAIRQAVDRSVETEQAAGQTR